MAVMNSCRRSSWFKLFVGVLFLVLVLCSASQAQTTFSNTASITLAASGAATPYPSGITVSGIATFTKITVAVSGISLNPYYGVELYLADPSNTIVIPLVARLNCFSSGTFANDNLVFDDAIGTSVVGASGTYHPTECGGFYTATGLPAALSSANLANFASVSPNGVWSLYAYTGISTGAGAIAGGWAITFVGATLLSAGGASGDPHVIGFDGRSFDLVGSKDQVYNLLTDPTVQLNVRLGVVRASQHADLPGLWMTQAGVKFANHSLVVLAGSHDRPASVLLDGQSIAATVVSSTVYHNVRATFVDPVVFVKLDQPVVIDPQHPNGHLVGQVDINADAKYRLIVMLIESGYADVGHKWITPVARRFLDVKVELLHATSSSSAIDQPHGLLGQSVVTAAKHTARSAIQAAATGVAPQNTAEPLFQGVENDYVIRGGDLLGDDFTFNRFANANTAK
jgi:hypothetical protein